MYEPARRISRAQYTEKEARRVIAFVNNRVVPRVRSYSSRTLQLVAARLQQFATVLDQGLQTGRRSKM